MSGLHLFTYRQRFHYFIVSFSISISHQSPHFNNSINCQTSFSTFIFSLFFPKVQILNMFPFSPLLPQCPCHLSLSKVIVCEERKFSLSNFDRNLKVRVICKRALYAVYLTFNAKHFRVWWQMMMLK